MTSPKSNDTKKTKPGHPSSSPPSTQGRSMRPTTPPQRQDGKYHPSPSYGTQHSHAITIDHRHTPTSFHVESFGASTIKPDTYPSTYPVIDVNQNPTPIENFEATSTYPYQRYSGYSPVRPQQYRSPTASTTPQDPIHNTHTSLAAADSRTMNGHGYPFASQGDGYHVWEPSYSYPESVDAEVDLVAIGSQFDGEEYGEYKQTLDA